MKQIMLGILFDETICRLPLTTRHKDYVFQSIKAIELKNRSVHHKDSSKFNTAYKLMNEAWVNAQQHFIKEGKEFSNVLFIKFMMEDEDWLSYFNLKQKRFNKLYDSYDLSKHILRTKQVYNEVMKQVDITLAHYNYNKENK